MASTPAGRAKNMAVAAPPPSAIATPTPNPTEKDDLNKTLSTPASAAAPTGHNEESMVSPQDKGELTIF